MQWYWFRQLIVIVSMGWFSCSHIHIHIHTYTYSYSYSYTYTHTHMHLIQKCLGLGTFLKTIPLFDTSELDQTEVLYICVSICMYIYIFINMHICMVVWLCVYLHTIIYIHMYTHSNQVLLQPLWPRQWLVNAIIRYVHAIHIHTLN